MGATSASDLSPELERQLGAAIMAQGRGDPTYIDDAEVNQYLTVMGRKLAAYSASSIPDVELFAVRDPEINAFAMPGGYVGVNSGLVVASGSESELAAVVAHEIGHVIQRHIARGMTQQNQNGMMMLAAVAGALLAALAGGGGNLAVGVAAFGQAAAINRQLGFSREAEREADRVGFQMLTRAGYDPNGMARMFAMLMNASRLNEGNGGGAWASTHPLSIERMSDIQNRARALPPSPYVDSLDYAYVRAKLRVLQRRDMGGQRSVGQQFEDEVKTLSGGRRSAAFYGLALLAFQRENYGQAQTYLDRAAVDGRMAPALAALQMTIFLAEKKPAEALTAAKAAWQRWPDRYALAIGYARALQQTGQYEPAQRFLRERVAQWGGDAPEMYRMLAQSEEHSGNGVAARRDMARYYLRVGALPAAAAQLQQARDLSRDFYEQSQIDVQLREVKEKMTDEQQLLERFKG